MTTARHITLLELSRQMLELAKRQEWETLAQMQEQRVKLISGESAENLSLTRSELAAEAQTIREIQNLDTEILEHVTPWRDDVAKLLSRLAPSQ